MTLNIEKIYSAQFKDVRFEMAEGRKGNGSKTRGQRFRALNYELEVFDEETGQPIGTIPGGFPVTQTTSHNNPLIRFFRSLGIFRNPDEFDPNELVGKEVRITVNNICENPIGLRSVVDGFFPMEV